MKMRKNRKKQSKNKSEMLSLFDVLGSYTGSYLKNELEEPVQDVDDL